MNPRRRLSLQAALLVLPAAVTGCASLDAPQTRGLAEQAGDLPDRSNLQDTPFFPQTPFHCGPAALATALLAAGISTTPEALSDGLFLPAREGTLQIEMLAAARRAGAVATRIPGELRAVVQELSAGHVVLVLQNLGLWFYPAWHYAVVVGHALKERELMLRSGTEREALLGFNTFEHTWARSGHWAVVVRQPGAWPVTAQVQEIEQSAAAFERVAAPAQALRAYQSLVQRWPDRLVGLMGLGNVQLQAGHARAAATAFEHAAKVHDSAAAWNNLAIALVRAGDKAGALQTAERAVARARSHEPAMLAAVQDTLDTLKRGEVPR